MDILKSIVNNHPVVAVLGLTVVWFVLLIVCMGIASSLLRRPYGDAVTGTIGRLLVIACALVLIWRLGWLQASGIARLGRWQVWLLVLGGMLYFTGAGLYSFYGKVTLNFSDLLQLPDSIAIGIAHFATALSEELLFRGVALYALTRVWGNTRQGLIGSVILTSLLFAILHITQVFTHGASLTSALLLTCQTCIISMWWAALVLWSGSIWPAVMLHFVVNAVVAVQGLMVPMIEPNILAYRRLLWFSIPLGILGVVLLGQTALDSPVSEMP